MKTQTYLAIDIGGTKIASGFVTFKQDGYIVDSSKKIPTQAHKGGADVALRLQEFVEERLKEAHAEKREISGIGIGSAGVVDSTSGMITSATDIMPGWAETYVVSILQTGKFAHNIPIYMVGDVGAHGLGEALYGAGRGYDSVLSVGIGTGIGGAFVNHGILSQGAHGVAGHVGHVPHQLGAGILCSCGSSAGHIEPVASGTGLATLYNIRQRNKNLSDFAIDGADVVSRMNSGDENARKVVVDSAYALGECIGGMANIIDPHIIVLSGSVIKAGPTWWESVQKGFTNSALPLLKNTSLVQSQLGDDAPLVGAASAIHRAIKN